MSIRPDDPRLAGLSPEDLATIDFNSNGQPDYVPRQPVPGTTGTSGVGQFTAEQAAAIRDAADQAAGLSGDAATAQYIRDLAAGKLGGATDTQAALNRLIAEGQARSAAATTPTTATNTSGSTTATVVPADDNETSTTILR